MEILIIFLVLALARYLYNLALVLKYGIQIRRDGDDNPARLTGCLRCGSRHYHIKPEHKFYEEGILPFGIQLYFHRCLDCGNEWTIIVIKDYSGTE